MKLSMHAKHRIEERGIKMQWVIATIENPDDIETISKTEVRYYKKISEFGNRVLKVVINPEKNIIITTYFDRGKKL